MITNKTLRNFLLIILSLASIANVIAQENYLEYKVNQQGELEAINNSDFKSEWSYKPFSSDKPVEILSVIPPENDQLIKNMTIGLSDCSAVNLDAKRGHILWNVEVLDNKDCTSIKAKTVKDRVIFFAEEENGENVIILMNKRDGSSLWKLEQSGMKWTKPSINYETGTMYWSAVQEGDNELMLYDIDLDTGKVRNKCKPKCSTISECPQFNFAAAKCPCSIKGECPQQ